jgi:beta-glucosidase
VSRDTVGYFCDYARAVVDCLGDAVQLWATVNEPFCSAMIGHLQGRHAPGIVDLTSALCSAHHLLLAHGQAVGIIQQHAPGARAGITQLLSDLTAASDSDADRATAGRIREPLVPGPGPARDLPR